MTQARYVVAALVLVGLGAAPALAQGPADNMTFFVTSSNPGNGGNLGGLSGADAHCESLAAAVGAGGKTWGMSRALLKLSGSLVHDYATISDDFPSPNRASRARRAATSAGIS